MPAINTDGVETRPNPLDNTEIFNFAPVSAKAIRVTAQAGADSFFAVTEVQVFAVPVPVPATLALLGIGLVAGVCVRRREPPHRTT